MAAAPPKATTSEPTRAPAVDGDGPDRTPPPVDADVAIVGYGPVGAAAAILLAGHGHRVVVLERWPTPYPLPRAVHFDHETARILQACGLGDDLARISEPAEVYEWRNAAGEVLLRFGRIGAGLSGWPESSMFNQPALEARLDRRARSLPGVEVRRGVEVVGLTQDGEGVTVHHRPVEAVDAGAGRPPSLTPAGDESALRARFVVGADGAGSTVRTLLDPPVRDLGYFYDWLVVDVVLDEPRVFDPVNLQICDPARPTTLVSGGPGRRRWEFMRLPGEPLDELHAEATAWRLLAPWDVHPGNATLERHAVYRFQARWVERWHDGRILLAGDAAHQTPPFAGQGMCAGLRDAANLAWKLDLVLRGRASVALLDTYDAERAPNMQALVQFAIDLGKVICVPDPAEAAARDAAMTAQVVPGTLSEVPPVPGIDHGVVRTDTPAGGQLFVQGRVARGAHRGRFDDVCGTGWWLVARSGAVPPDGGDRAWFADIGGRIVTVGDGGELDDLDGAYDTWFARHAVAVALVRPDFHVYGTAADADGAAGLLASLRADLGDG